ncbi:hypothetical protein HYPSUDRAFT_826997 [Hypholoma sublateritium FD-334 SS-4]|uniref:Defective in cullin neddylation protein n=1 Tax=Hypholoma sublateritium (strain FD-334 SS-4) TaxID=945553 RepID=A0A0D2L0V7_HYPSF|nr:hypothetical protein HYPSUDRAFT_826997 [Hypholoma sublateritium FD-334 SS-4]
MRFSSLLCCSSNHIKNTHSDDEPAPTRNASPKVHPTPASNPKLSLHLDHASASAPKSTKKPAKNEPYSVQRAQALFSTYADSDDASVIGPEGFEKLCADAGIPMDGSCPLILAWLMQAKEMGKISKEEWTHVIIEGKPPIKPTAKKDQEYDRTVYFSYVSNPQSALQKLYHFSYALAKPEQSKNIDMDTSAALVHIGLPTRIFGR